MLLGELGDLVERVGALIPTSLGGYEVTPEVQSGGKRHESLHGGARTELGWVQDRPVLELSRRRAHVAGRCADFCP